MKIPSRLSLSDIQQSFRDLWARVDSLFTGNIDLKGRRIINAGKSVGELDYVIRQELNNLGSVTVNQQVQTNPGGMLNIHGDILQGTYAARPASVSVGNGTVYITSDQNGVLYAVVLGVWVYAGGTMYGTTSAPDQRPALAAGDKGFRFVGTDDHNEWVWTGAAWERPIKSFGAITGFGTTDFETWSASYTAIQIGATLALIGSNSSTTVGYMSNAYLDAAGAWRYKTTAAACMILLIAGSFKVYVAASGAADAVITWTVAFSIDPTALFTLVEGANLALGTVTGSQFGTAANQKLAFHGASAVIQRANAQQADIASTAATNTTPWGFSTQAQADGIVTLLREIRAAVIEKGLIKGSA